MNCCLTDLREKEVINLKDGCRLGCVCDVEIDSCTGRLVAIIIFGKKQMVRARAPRTGYPHLLGGNRSYR